MLCTHALEAHNTTQGVACNVVAIALFRKALTAYEDAVGPLVQAWAKNKCAVLHLRSFTSGSLCMTY